MNELMDAMEIWIEIFTMDHNLSSTRNQESRKPWCVEQAQIAPKDMQEHIGPSLLVEYGDEKQLKRSSPRCTFWHFFILFHMLLQYALSGDSCY